MDTQSLFRQWSTVRGRDVGIRHHVQAPGNIQYRYCALYKLVIPAVGDQAVLESARRYPENQAELDCRDAVADRGRSCWCRTDVAGR